MRSGFIVSCVAGPERSSCARFPPTHGLAKCLKAFVEKNLNKAIADFFDQLMLYSSTPHAAKSRIHVLVVRLEPVAKTRSQHACRRARRTTFEHVMLVVVEVRGVTQIERKRLESG